MPFSTNTFSKSNGVTQRAVATLVTSAASATDQTLNFGFVPRKVTVINLTDRITHEWYEGMAAASALMTIANGTRSLEVADALTVYATNVAAQAASKQLGDVVLDATVLVASKSFRVVAED